MGKIYIGPKHELGINTGPLTVQPQVFIPEPLVQIPVQPEVLKQAFKEASLKVSEPEVETIYKFVEQEREVIYVDRPVEVIKEVEKIVYVDRTVEVPVEKLVQVETPVEKITYVDKIVEKPTTVVQTKEVITVKEKIPSWILAVTVIQTLVIAGLLLI